MHTACSFPTDDPAVFALSSPRAVRYWSPNFESLLHVPVSAGTVPEREIPHHSHEAAMRDTCILTHQGQVLQVGAKPLSHQQEQLPS